jgi:hypothetical protein
MRRQGEAEHSEGGTFPPIRVFLVLMTVLVVVGAVVFFTSNDPAPEPMPTQSTSPDYSLTDAEAIARFKELHATLLTSYRQRDASLLDSYLTADSPLRARASKEIRQLLRDEVLDRAKIETLKLRVVRNDADDITLRHTTVENPHFVSEGGENVTSFNKPILQVTDWTLRLDESLWKIFESDVVRSRRYRDD